MRNRFRKYSARQFTCALLEAIDDGAIDPTVVARMCVNHMSEADIKYMMWMNELYYLVEEENDYA